MRGRVLAEGWGINGEYSRLCFQDTQESVEGLPVGVVVFPAAEVSDRSIRRMVGLR